MMERRGMTSGTEEEKERREKRKNMMAEAIGRNMKAEEDYLMKSSVRKIYCNTRGFEMSEIVCAMILVILFCLTNVFFLCWRW